MFEYYLTFTLIASRGPRMVRRMNFVLHVRVEVIMDLVDVVMDVSMGLLKLVRGSVQALRERLVHQRCFPQR